ncbi:hypothetical protein [Shewanella sp. Isolate11]|uniref:DUF6942 family protein n=1 Tax=Shewanella sp. Isolate11 TaxID=2908530 RepID=UPI001EFD5D78|nr:hypothetical protein [Shewanella sp. Isolate11]MCG9698353.1 hypothetical protein [Shewanella sp. Isolate11]
MSRAAQSLGPSDARTCFYLPNSPLLPEYFNKSGEINIDDIIELNGNHWRKIFVIMAKIAAPDDNWREYKVKLLQRHESIAFGATELNSEAKLHLVCGHQSALSLALPVVKPAKSFQLLSQNGQQIGLLPYLDYRQCPNALIEQLRQQIN